MPLRVDHAKDLPAVDITVLSEAVLTVQGSTTDEQALQFARAPMPPVKADSKPRAVMVSVDKDLLALILSENLADVVAIFDPTDQASALGIPVVGKDEEWSSWCKLNPDVKVIFAIDIPQLRQSLLKVYGATRSLSIIARSAKIDRSVKIGSGCIIQSDVRLSADVTVGSLVKINIGAVVHHDGSIGDYCTLAPRACLLGSVRVEEGAYIGANATILPRRVVGRGAIVGAGAVVTRDVPEFSVVAGVPARKVKK